MGLHNNAKIIVIDVHYRDSYDPFAQGRILSADNAVDIAMSFTDGFPLPELLVWSYNIKCSPGPSALSDQPGILTVLFSPLNIDRYKRFS